MFVYKPQIVLMDDLLCNIDVAIVHLDFVPDHCDFQFLFACYNFDSIQSIISVPRTYLSRL